MLDDVKAKIGELMRGCETIERSADSSRKLLDRHAKNLFKCIEVSEATFELINKDEYLENYIIGSLTGYSKKIPLKDLDEGRLFQNLSARRQRMLRDMGEYFNVVERFTKEESEEFLRNKEATRRPYESQMARLAKGQHTRLKHSKRCSPYLLQMEKTLARMSLS